MKKFKLTAMLAGIATAATLTACSSMQGLDMAHLGSALQKGATAMTLSNDQVAQYVHQAVAQMDAQNKVAPASSDYTKRLARITKGLNRVGNMPLNYKVYITPDVNAFACADGSVRVFSGIMDLMTDDELLGIIGHEIGHVAHEDSKNAMKQQLLNGALVDAIGSTGSMAAAITDGQLGQMAQGLMSAKYSRSQESNADDYGYDVLKATGHNPYYMVLAFEKMQELEAGAGAGRVSGSLANAFSDHPDTQARIAAMKKRCAADGFTRPSQATNAKQKAAKTSTKQKTSKKSSSKKAR